MTGRREREGEREGALCSRPTSAGIHLSSSAFYFGKRSLSAMNAIHRRSELDSAAAV